MCHLAVVDAEKRGRRGGQWERPEEFYGIVVRVSVMLAREVVFANPFMVYRPEMNKERKRWSGGEEKAGLSERA